MQIEIIAIPHIATQAGSAPLPHREAWLGVQIHVPTDREMQEDPPREEISMSDRVNCYAVRRVDAVTALRKYGKAEAADFWDNPAYGNYIFFPAGACAELTKAAI